MRIGSSLFGVDLAAQRGLMQAFEQLSLSSIRLSTMKRINGGADDPAGLISVGKLESELASLQAAHRNTSRTRGVVHTADSALGQTSVLLRDIRANVLEVAGGGLSDAEVNAKQIEINAAVDAVNMIGRTTSYGGRKPLDGSFDPDAGGQAMTFSFSADPSDTVSLALPTVDASALGSEEGSLAELASGGLANMKDGDLETAMAIVDAAEDQVLASRAQAGAFEKYTIDSSRNILDSMEENISQGLSLIRDTDVAKEMSNYIRSQLLVQSALTTLTQTGERRSVIASLFDGD